MNDPTEAPGDRGPHHRRRRRAERCHRHGRQRPVAGHQPAQGRRRAGRRRAQGPRVRACRRRRGRADLDRLPRRQGDPAPLDGARDGAGRARPVPEHAAGHRAAGRERFLLRLRRRAPVHPRGPQGCREADAGDRQGPAAVRSPRHLRRRRQGGAGWSAVQARADRAQGWLRRRGERRGRRGSSPHDVRQPVCRRRTGLDRPVPRPAPADHPAHPGVHPHALGGRLLARQ